MTVTKQNAEIIAIQALGFLASDVQSLGVFLANTGAGPADIRTRAGDPVFLAGVIDHLLADESLLLVFCETAGIAPDLPARARHALDHGQTTDRMHDD